MATKQPSIPSVPASIPPQSNTARTPPLTSSSSPSSPSVPFYHVLMLSSNPQQAAATAGCTKFKDDYLSRRYRALQSTTSSSSSSPSEKIMSDMWQCASPIERALIDGECCYVDNMSSNNNNNSSSSSSDKDHGGLGTQQNNPQNSEQQGKQEDDDEEQVPGSLLRPAIPQFTYLVTRHCHNMSSRALVLAILERTLEQDQFELEQKLEILEEEQQQQQQEEEEQQQQEEGQDEKQEPKSESNITKEANDGSGDGNTTPTPTMMATTATTAAAAVVKTENSKWMMMKSKRKKRKVLPGTPRLKMFLQAGGLRILKQWFVDAITPTVKVVTVKDDATKSITETGPSDPTLPPITKKARTSYSYSNTTASTPNTAPKTTTKTTTEPSEFGAMILPLLELLKDLPFDKRLITETRMNKTIRDYKKQIDVCVQHKQHYAPIGGGVATVGQIQKALDRLMKRWKEHMMKQQEEEQDDKDGDDEDTVVDPFANLLKTMKERLSVLKQYETGEADKPSWLAELEEEEKREKERKVMSKMSAKELAELQKQKERERALEQIKKTQEQASKKMELLKQKRLEAAAAKALSNTQSVAPSSSVARKKSNKSVRWRDGLGRADKLRKRNLLEEVFHYSHPEEDDDDDDEISIEIKMDPEDRIAKVEDDDDDDDDEDMFADDSDDDGDNTNGGDGVKAEVTSSGEQIDYGA